MAELDDHQLLAEFARENSEAAFAALVERHVGLVYSVALRSAGNAHAAEEITQAVFIILARKAEGLSAKIILSGWLYQTTRLTAANFLRTEIRRQHREQEAYMQSLLNEPNATETWTRIAPLLDDALDKLGPRDRDAIAMRFFENKSMAEIGAATGASEDAAKVRVNRALEKLRKIFTKRGVTLSALAIAGAVSANSVQAAPVALAKSVTAVAILKGSIASASTLTLVKGTMKTMAWLKIKFAVGVSVATLLAGGVATVAISQTSSRDNLTAQEIVKKSLGAYATLSSYSDSGQTKIEQGKQIETIDFSIRLQRPNFYRIEWSQAKVAGKFNKDSTFTSNSSKGIVWSSGDGDFFVTDQSVERAKLKDMRTALGYVIGVSGNASTVVPGLFFDLKRPEYGERSLDAGNATLERQKDETVDGVDCHVVSSRRSGSKTLWIGKQDHLVRKIKTVVETFSAPHTDAELKAILESQKMPATPEAIASLKQGLNEAQHRTVVFTQTHENIIVNQKFSSSDFAR